MSPEEIYKQLGKQYKRLTQYHPYKEEEKDKAINTVADKYIYKLVSDKELLAVYKAIKSTSIKDTISNEVVKTQAIKVLTIMEASGSLEEFEGLFSNIMKNKKPKQKDTDYDKLLDAFLKVPKPAKGDKKDKKRATKE